MPDDVTETYNVVIEGAGLSFSREIDAPTLGRIMHVMLGGGPLGDDGALLVSSAEPTEKEAASRPRRLSLREFLMSTGAKRYPDKIVAIGHYLEEHEGKTGFSKEDIKARFRAAGEAPPGNFPRDFSVAVAHGWIAEDPENPGQLYVTTSGQEAIAEGFSNVTRAPRRRSSRRRRSPTAAYQTA